VSKQYKLGGKPPLSGNRVSHSHRKTRHQWLPNMQRKALYSTTLDKTIRITLPASALRSVDRCGGLDEYLLQIKKPEELTTHMQQLRAEIVRKRT
jgi:large subunit ribosomal protein L28